MGSLKTVARELGKYKLDLVGVRRSDGRREALNGQRIIHFSMDRGMGIISQGQDFSYIRESYQRLGERNLLVIGCHI
jgi:TPP-dependent indolepyruvate ferredoxin oxidoreductase alpha subunit